MAKRKVNRSAENGEFVSEEEAAENPATTVEEIIDVPETSPEKVSVEETSDAVPEEVAPEESSEDAATPIEEVVSEEEAAIRAECAALATEAEAEIPPFDQLLTTLSEA